jgi:predicted nucleotidyltransferase
MLAIPQGLTEDQFIEISAEVCARVAHISQDIQVQGSRVIGTAEPDSDLDIAIRVNPERFEQVLSERFGSPKPGSAKERTMQHARKSGKIQAGEAGLRTLRKDLENLLGIEVDISIIRQGGPFDHGPNLPLKETKEGG